MSEWLKEHAWKACVGETLPWVRIPLSPPIPPRPRAQGIHTLRDAGRGTGYTASTVLLSWTRGTSAGRRPGGADLRTAAAPTIVKTIKGKKSITAIAAEAAITAR